MPQADITDQELRDMIRESIARLATHDEPDRPVDRVTAFVSHASHLRLPLAAGGELDGACVIEPAVRCNHCGYCLSYGH